MFEKSKYNIRMEEEENCTVVDSKKKAGYDAKLSCCCCALSVVFCFDLRLKRGAPRRQAGIVVLSIAH
jgi:hypothetical protein